MSKVASNLGGCFFPSCRGLPTHGIGGKSARSGGGSLMFLSSVHRSARDEELAVGEHCPEDVDSAPREGDDGLMVAFALLPFARVEGAAVAVAQRGER